MRASMPTTVDQTLAGAYSYLQKVVGVIAVLFPVVVPAGDWLIDGHGLRGSLSAYYYGRTGGYFVGSLCAMAVFFLSYEYRPRPGREWDNRLANVACFAALGVALLPTASNGGSATGGAAVVSFLHLASAGLLFVLLAIFSLYQFTKTAGEDTGRMPLGERLGRLVRTAPGFLARMTPRKRVRNRVHRACGWVIVACIVGILLSNAFHWGLLFWLEAVAVLAFGFSWLVKGDFFPFLADEPVVDLTAPAPPPLPTPATPAPLA